METKNAATILWSNIKVLMDHLYGKENLNQLARDARIGAATVMRIKKLEGGTRLSTLIDLTKAFKALHLQPWELLHPDGATLALQRKLSLEQRDKIQHIRTLISELPGPAQRELFGGSREIKEMLEKDPYPDERLEERGWSAATKPVSRKTQ